MAKNTVIVTTALLFAIFFQVWVSAGIASALVSDSLSESLRQECAETNYDCFVVNFSIISHDIRDAFIAGDTFHVEINVTALNKPFSGTAFVKAFDPAGNQISAFSETLSNASVFYLKEKPWGNVSNYTVTPFSSSGIYRAELELNAVPYPRLIIFEKSQSQRNSFKNISFYFDVMPKWQKDWQDSLTNQSARQEALLGSISSIYLACVD